MVRDQFFNPIPDVVTKNLDGQTVIVTGANTGIGFEAAKHFATMNPGRLIIACRDADLGNEALVKIKHHTGFVNVELWVLNLASFSSVNVFAKKFEKEGGRLDILVENAAMAARNKIELTDDGWESVFQVNHLSTSLLGLLLLPRMLETAKTYQIIPRLVVVSSGVHHWTKIEETVISSESPLKVFGSSLDYLANAMPSRYRDTKLLNLFFARALNDRLLGQPIIVNSVDPGYAYSNLRRNFKGLRAIIDWFMEKAIAIISEQASRQLIWASVSDPIRHDNLRGAFIMYGTISEPSDYVISPEGISTQNILWDNLIEELIKVNTDVAHVVKEHLRQTTAKTRVY